MSANLNTCNPIISGKLEPQSSEAKLIKVGQNLYGYSSNGEYYYLIKIHGKQFKGKLGTINCEEAKRLLIDKQRELALVGFAVLHPKLCGKIFYFVQTFFKSLFATGTYFTGSETEFAN